MNDDTYKLYTDAGSRGNPGNAAAAAILLNWKDMPVDLNGVYLGVTTNNIAEYEGLILGLKLAMKHGCKKIQCMMDSELVIKQVKGEYKIKNSELIKKMVIVKSLIQEFESVIFEHVLRNKNTYADHLVNIILDAKK